ncbi:acyltransferase domain-containing protein [Actinomadura sp. J1-007]|nr:acyltransferase domain-containing protein [Actinomadura sp. J1-007]
MGGVLTTQAGMPSDRLRSPGTDAAADGGAGDGARRWFGGFLEAVDGFDAGFFGIAPREAVAMDPQQRLMLEVAWEALEDAGIPPETLAGSRTGVFVGAIWDEYAAILRRSGPGTGERHAMTGSHRSIIANRVSYVHGLRGPSMTIDTAQSSSLVAVHAACESIRNGECSLALAGGVNLILGEDGMEAAAAQFGGLSPDGRCHTFDARANGFVRGEGAATVVLKPLDAALIDGDPVYCVIRGSAVNHDGAADGLTVPSAAAQEDVLRLACERARVAPGDVQYVELHGTGTPVGDPVEAAAVGAALGASRAHGAPLRVGSAKTNVGHLEGAAGIVGLLKAVLSVAHRELPPSLNFTAPNPRIPLAELGLRVQDELTAWPCPDRPLIAGVSSFGMGGTNCHVVLTEPPATAAEVPATGGATRADEPGTAAGRPAAPVPSNETPPIVPWTVSGKSAAALRAQADRLREHVEDRPGLDPADVGHALGATRSAFAHRAVVLGGGADELLGRLGALGRGEDAPGVVHGTVNGGGVAVLFSGQGSQRPRMGRELYDAHPVFAAALDEAFACLDPMLDRPLREVVWSGDAAPLDRTAYTQPALFAVEVALYRLAESWGLRPGHLIGHSVGEIAAAHVAGALSLPDACTLVAARGRLMQAVTAPGAMAALRATPDEAAELVAGRGGLGVAAVNGPASVVISGDRDAVRDAAAAWRDRGGKATLLRVSHAFHSPHMDAMLDELRAVAAGLAFAAPAIPVVSNVTGLPATAERLASPDYWAEHARRAVRFMPGVRYLCGEGVTTFVELGPDGQLAAMARESFPGPSTEGPDGRPRPAARPVALAALRRDRPETATFATAMAEAYVRGGVDLDWDRIFAGRARTRVDLPTYAFQRERYWPGSLPRPEAVPAGQPGPGPEAGPVLEAEPPSPLERLAGLSEPERRRALLDLVRTNAAVVLGHASGTAIDADLTFKQLGFDSMAAGELSERLGAATGLPLPATLTFDHPTPLDVAAHLNRRATATPDGTSRQDAPAAGRSAADDPIAVVAMSCRYPGGATTPEALWDLVAAGRDVIGGFPDDRGWDLAALFDPDTDRAGTTYAREGGFLYDAAEFDAEFFGISPREAQAMDPQQRLLLETSWEAFERAGIRLGALKGSPTGVFVGATAQDYGPRLHEAPKGLDGHLLTGATPSVASGRVAFTFGLVGPAVTVDTACSSSLVAMHLAAQALRQGECDLALAGGATVLAAPGMFTGFSRQRGLAPDGRCKPFAAAADGTGWAEGVGLVLLERLSDALRNGRRVLAVIRGSAVNQDGASNGLTAPNGPSQERVIRQALASAGLSSSDVDAVEAHGTGTTLGDPIEAGALLATYGRGRSGGRPLWLGSVKSNIGHTQAAAGVAGVIKTVMAMRNGSLPASLHIDEPSPHVDWKSGAVRLLTEPMEWPTEDDRPRRAAVSSFGISGTNAHLILEAPPEPDSEPERPAPMDVGPLPWVLSARSEEALRGQAAALASQVRVSDDAPLDVGWSLAASRSNFERRAVVVGTGRDELLAGLEAVASGEVRSVAPSRVGAGPVLVFPGQGSQWAGMGAGLLDSSPVFAERVAECERALAPFVDWSLSDVLRGDGAELARVDVVQPVLWATMVSLAAVWASYGVVPSAVIGHSQGEIAAACVAGALSLEAGARIVALRSRALRRLAGGGAMASLGVGVDAAQEFLSADVAVAAVNGPSSTVVSGPPEQVTAAVARVEAAGYRARLIDVDYASHGPQVDEITDELHEVLAGIEPAPTTEVAFYSTVSGGRIDTTSMDTGYWVTNLRERVRFADAVRELAGDGHRVFIEASPHPVLTLGTQETLEEAGTVATVVPTLRRDHGGRRQLADALGQAFAAGVEVDWSRWFTGDRAPRLVELPTYAFQRRRYWLDGRSGPGGDPESLGLASAGHRLLGAAVEHAGADAWLLTGRLSTRTQPWLAQHSVAGTVVVPGAALVEWALRAADEAGCGGVDELTPRVPLVLAGPEPVRVQVAVDAAADDGTRDVRVYSRPDGDEEAEWTCHAEGVLSAGSPEPAPEPEPGGGGAWPPPGAEPLAADDVYERLAEAGYDYGQAFQGVRALWRQGADLLADLVLPEAAGGPGGFGIHPALLDAALHPSLLDAGPAGDGRVWQPFAWSGVSLWAAEATAVRVRLTPHHGEQGVQVAVAVTDALGGPVLDVASVVMRPADVRWLREGGHRAGRRASTAAGGTTRVRRAVAAGGGNGSSVDWADRLAGLAEDERRRLVLDLVRTHAATVLGHAEPDAVPTGTSFKEMGFESLTAVELRDRLAAATGLRLPAALVFRYPTPDGIADHLVERLVAKEQTPPNGRNGGRAGEGGNGGERGNGNGHRSVTGVGSVLGELDRLEDTLAGFVPENGDSGAVTARLERLLTKWKAAARNPAGEPSAAERLESASTDQVLDFIENELGVS